MLGILLATEESIKTLARSHRAPVAAIAALCLAVFLATACGSSSSRGSSASGLKSGTIATITVSSPPGLGAPGGLALDGAGNLYVTDTEHCVVRKIAGGIDTVVAGNGICGDSGDGGPATSASISVAYGVAFTSGRLLIADTYNCRVRQVDSSGIIRTIAGNGRCGFAGDGGPATQARLNRPSGIAVDRQGNIYVADEANCRVRRIHNGVITTVVGIGPNPETSACGYGGDGGPATGAAINHPFGVAVDSADNLYISDTANCRLREVRHGIITSIAGHGEGPVVGCAASGDGGPASAAYLYHPQGIAVDAAGRIYIADSASCRVRVIGVAGTITTVAGIGTGLPTTCGDSGDGGSAVKAMLNQPSGVAVDAAGDVFVADAGNRAIRVVYSGK